MKWGVIFLTLFLILIFSTAAVDISLDETDYNYGELVDISVNSCLGTSLLLVDNSNPNAFFNIVLIEQGNGNWQTTYNTYSDPYQGKYTILVNCFDGTTNTVDFCVGSDGCVEPDIPPPDLNNQSNNETDAPEEIIASCDDGIKNQDESQVDCGGTCSGYWYNSDCNDDPEPEINKTYDYYEEQYDDFNDTYEDLEEDLDYAVERNNSDDQEDLEQDIEELIETYDDDLDELEENLKDLKKEVRDYLREQKDLLDEAEDNDDSEMENYYEDIVEDTEDLKILIEELLKSVADERDSLDTNTINASNCTPSWSCTSWNACNSSSKQSRECMDMNECLTDRTEVQSCTYTSSSSSSSTSSGGSSSCLESWVCQDWNECTNSKETRTCLDENRCGTTITKPAILRNCQESSLPSYLDDSEDNIDTSSNSFDSSSDFIEKDEESSLLLPILFFSSLILIAVIGGLVYLLYLRPRMVPTQLKDYVKEERQKGATDGGIKKALINSGWDTEKVEKALKHK